MHRFFGISSLLVLIPFFVSVTGCAGDEGGSTGTEQEQTEDTGTLSVNIKGLPGEAEADVTVEGEEFHRELTSPGTNVLSAVPAGEHTVNVEDVEYGPGIYVGQDDVTATVEPEQTTEVAVDYESVPGSLRVDTTGVPEGSDATGSIGGPELATTFTAPDEFEELDAGDYHVSFETIETDDLYYDPEPAEQDVTVASDSTAEAVADYSIRPGELHVDVDIPESVEMTAEVTSDNETVATINSEGPVVETLELEPGTYQIDATDFPSEDEWDNPFVYEGEDATVEVESGGNHTHIVATQLPTRVTTEEDSSGVYGSLREVADRVNPDSEITFAGDVNQIALDETLVVVKPLSFIGNGDSETVITQSSESSERLFQVDIGDEIGDTAPEVLFQELTFEGADAPAGAAMRLVSPGAGVTFFGVDFRNNVATEAGGGALHIANTGGADVHIQDVVFEDNLASSNASDDYGGGAIRFLNPSGGILELKNTTFEANESKTHGGALRVLGASTVQMETTTFENNEADLDGGAIHAMWQSLVLGGELEFSTNTAVESGGAIRAGGELELDRSTFSENEATSGGAVRLLYDTRMEECHFVGNAADDGGAINGSVHSEHEGRSDLHLKSSLFEDNTAEVEGGAAYLELLSAKITNTTFANNHAGERGGGIFGGNDLHGELRFSTMIDNSADSSGAALLGIAALYVYVLRGNYLADNTAPTDNQLDTESGTTFGSAGYNFIGATSSIDDNVSTEQTDVINGAADYEPLSDNGGFTETYALEAGSSGYRDVPTDDCRWFGMATLLTRDQRGEPRPSSTRCSSGAWEADSEHEDFEQAGFPETYGSGSFQGVDGRTWEYTDVRSADYWAIAGRPGARLAADGGSISASGFEGIDGGDVESIGIVYGQAQQTDTQRQFEVLIDGEVVETSPEFGSSSALGAGTIHVLELDDLDVGSDFELEIRNVSDLLDGEIVIDQITWR